jgi:hypothetical protein
MRSLRPHAPGWTVKFSAIYVFNYPYRWMVLECSQHLLSIRGALYKWLLLAVYCGRLVNPLAVRRVLLCYVQSVTNSIKKMENSTSNTTTPGDPSFLWKAEPTQRGTFGIFSFCLSTLIICVWSALHFDIPTARHKLTHQFFIHVYWMVVALIAPEVLLCAAINQRIDAEILTRKAIEYLPQKLAKPGIFARCFHLRAKPEAVSTPKFSPFCCNSLDLAGAP